MPNLVHRQLLIRFYVAVFLILFVFDCDCLSVRAEAETGTEAAQRHQRVAERRRSVHLICHRGAVEAAHENTLEAYRAAFELGGDGNEIDIRMTKDGVLVCFHDDMVDHLLDGYGDVSDFLWQDLQLLKFRNPGRFGVYCRIPTLREVFKLHRDQSGLLFLDIKRPGLQKPISDLLDEYDMWDHVIQAPGEFVDVRIQRTRVKAGMYLDHSEVDEAAIQKVLLQPGERILLESPQQVAKALGRTVRVPDDKPFRDDIALWSRSREHPVDPRRISELLAVLNDAKDGNFVAVGDTAETDSAERILSRAKAADEVARRGIGTPDVFSALESRVRDRSLHRNWRYCGLDGCAALRALLALKGPQAASLARFCIWRDDPGVEAARNPEYINPRSWTDFRTKLPVFKMLESLPSPESEKICRDYLALTDDEATAIGVPQFKDAATTLLKVSPQAATIQELLKHRLSVVRGRAILFNLTLRTPIGNAAEPKPDDDEYYHSGELAGSLRSSRPIRLFDADPIHLWNRLFSALYIRPRLLAATSDRPATIRYEGGDVIEFLAWGKTEYWSTEEVSTRLNLLLDEFLESDQPPQKHDPLKQIVLQHDLWAAHDHLIDLNNRRVGDIQTRNRRDTLCRKLAKCMQRLAISKIELEQLPDTYTLAIRSGAFAPEHNGDSSVNYLPHGLLDRPDEWVEIDVYYPNMHEDIMDRFISLHARSFMGRSHYRIFYRFPEGREQVVAFLKKLENSDIDWKYAAQFGFLQLNKDAPQIPVGTEVLLLQQMIVLNDEMLPVPTNIVESVQFRTYLNIDGTATPQTNTGVGMNVLDYRMKRRLLFDGLKSGGLEREHEEEPQYRVAIDGSKPTAPDWNGTVVMPKSIVAGDLCKCSDVA